MSNSLNLIFSTTEALQYYAATIAWTDTDKSMNATGIGTGTFANGDTIFVSSADETANNGQKTIVSVAADKIIIAEDVTADGSDAIVVNQIVVGSWMPVSFYSRLVGALSCSQNATLYADWSVDGGTTTIVTQSTSISAGTPAAYAQEVIAPFVRFRLLNAGTDQTAVAVHIYGKENY